MLFHALGIYPKQAKGFKAIREYFIGTTLPQGTAGNGWRSSYPGPHVSGADFVGAFWRRHAAAIGLTL